MVFQIAPVTWKFIGSLIVGREVTFKFRFKSYYIRTDPILTNKVLIFCNQLNNYFVRVGETSADKIQANDIDPLDYIYGS